MANPVDVSKHLSISVRYLFIHCLASVLGQTLAVFAEKTQTEAQEVCSMPVRENTTQIQADCDKILLEYRGALLQYFNGLI
jgi:hypothetical protein